MDKVAIQGFTGSFHAIATEKYFGPSHQLVMCDSFPNLFKSLGNGGADCAVIAIENTIAGTILFNYSLLLNSPYSIMGETSLRIEHCLLALKGQSIEDIKEVRSHPMALMQCMRFFSGRPEIKLVEDIDTAYVAELIAKNQTKGVAAIAGEGVAEKFGLEILKRNIEDSEKNFTRFLIIKKIDKDSLEIEGANKASIWFRINHEVGSLRNILNCMAKRNINITSLQSTPFVGNEWEYNFHMDAEFTDILNWKELLNEMKAFTKHLSLLGVYKKGI